MSSLSQEDLDAGWDEPEGEQPAAGEAEAAQASTHASTPPNSITVNTTQAQLQSMIVHSPPPAPSDEAEPDAAACATEAAATELTPESLPEHACEGNLAEVDSGEASQPAQSDAPASESRVRTVNDVIVPILPATADEVAPGDLSPSADFQPEAESSPRDSHEAALTDGVDSNLEPFVTVAEKPQSLSQRGVETASELESARSDAALTTEPSRPTELIAATAELEQSAAIVDNQTEAALTTEPARLTESAAVTATLTRSAAAAAEPAVARVARSPSSPVLESPPDEPMAVELAPLLPTPSIVVRHWRLVVVAGAAMVALVAGLLAIRSKHQAKVLEQRASVMNVVAAKPDPASPIAVTGSSANVETVASAAIGAPEPTHSAPTLVASPQAESFSDAFVKHAATVNSNYAEAKKRPRAPEAGQPVRPAATSNAKASEDPLDLLDKLEKARKAKKSAGK